MEKSKTFRPIPGLSREDEEQQLTEILQVAQENLVRTEQRIHQLSDELYDLMETYGPKDKEALSLLHNAQSQLRENQRDLIRCRKARKKPYFGRIDFKDSKLPQEESYYVGRVGISKSGSDPIVIDWRAPLASVYYENVMGPCRYIVKNEGICEIDLKRKRTYEIEQDKLVDFFDSDVVANDELLTKYLAKSKKAVLGEIIATIQKEQNDIIRKSPKTNLIVQGVAGSGKTTVAMHRISYILYNYEDDFRPEDFYIIGSNRILLNYITSVLPDLDVYGVSQMTMEQLFVRLLYEDWDSAQYHIVPLDQSNLQFIMKGSYAWFHDLERFCEEYECSVIPRQDVSIEKNGKVLLEKEVISDSIKNYPAMSMQSKINMLNAMLLSRLENELSGKYVSYTPEEKKELHRNYRWYFGKDVWKGSIFDLYRGFL
ncbi:MAG: DNA helicase UvrD, partial [Oliverpabstia sp.]|nr:DNA helicase UvrD [Oliverpabstia sp.]